MKQIRYIIADDHQIFREGVKLVLEDDPSLKLLGEASSGIELMEMLIRLKPDIILMDVKMPGMDGLEATKEIKKLYPRIRILILTMYDDPQFIIHLLQAGANGYLLKNSNAEEIKISMHSVHETGSYFSELVSKTMLKNIVNTDKTEIKFKPNIKLNENEIEMIRMICNECTTAQVADILSISIRSAERMRATLLEKIGVKNTAGLVIYAMKQGIYRY